MHRRSFALAALAVLAALPACSNDTAPDPTEGKSHPAGSVADRITFNTGHISLQSLSAGWSLCTLSGGGRPHRSSTQSPYTKLTALMTGPGPRDIVIDRAGTTAYASTEGDGERRRSKDGIDEGHTLRRHPLPQRRRSG